MFLKRLEVKGFKSFAEPILVDFVPGVTAVVGPNGSGKSNIADAVRWVLGEQSARSLRGAKMEDIIFAGSDSRKAVNMAEVSLILDNEDGHLAIDYSEVSVTRRLYRSGKSEYLINRNSCRLKDIVDLFLDSGLGREAYSIIGQGKIEEILSSKAEERRTIFEEAAGVLKYKTRKNKAVKRLEQTEENLVRVADILNELEEQVEPLREQASIAEEYKLLAEEQRTLDIQVIAQEITELYENWTSESDKLKKLKEQLQARKDSLEKAEEKLAAYREEHAAIRQTAADLHKKRLEVSEALEKNEGRRGVLEERKKHALHNEEQLIEAIKEREANKIALQQKLDELLKQYEAVKQKDDELKANFDEAERHLTRSKEDVSSELEDAKGDYIEWLNEQASLRNERRYLEEQLQQKQRNARRAESAAAASKKEAQQLEQEAAERAQVLKAAEQSFAEAKMTQHRYLSEEETVKNRYYKREAKLYEAYGLLQKITSRREVLQEMEAEYAGFFQGVKEILKQRGSSLPGIVGAAAELISVPKKFEAAIELVLGAQAQYVVVDDEAAAREAISFLKQRRLGRATFLPLTTVKARVVPEAVITAIANEPGYLGIAADVVGAKPEHKQAVGFLLGSTILAETLPQANKIAKRSGHRFRVVTLEGDIVNPGGSMTGGSAKQNQSSLLGRKREKEELDAKKTKLEEAIRDLEKQVKHDKERRQQLQETIAKGEAQKAQAQETLEEAQRAYQEASIAYERARQEVERIEQQSKEQDAEEAKTLDRFLEIEEAEKKAIAESMRLEEKIKQLEARLASEQQSKEEWQAKLTELRVTRAETKQQLQYVDAQRQELAAALQKEQQELLQAKEHLALVTSSADEQAHTSESLAEQIAAGKQEKQALAAKLAELEEKEAALNDRYKQLEAETKSAQGEHSYLLEESQKLEVRVNRLDVDLDYRLNRLREEYELSYEAAASRYPLSQPLEQAKMRLSLVKRSIDELGTVNLGAIEEYARVRERYEFLREQKSDLLEARVSLDQAIAEMDEEMSKRFGETFANIRAHFQTVFTKLFGGGDADLVLTNKDDLLTTGIEIIARPPGKKRQQLGLLSGGERALTAIALLFAILQVRPVPFCVLDEVEAALDEANVSRFAQYLHDFSQKTQFIVITHRKGTMEGADVLYGVTMEESGVSRLVSVKLEETRQLIGS
ncbi:chromosome segregation protein SMC [Shouchella clausii]|uniref:chromosome segregation protein SMC n=1 Tax=Shouchella clausii TaxID=79880 RepID=UPI0031FD5ABF